MLERFDAKCPYFIYITFCVWRNIFKEIFLTEKIIEKCQQHNTI